MPELVITIYSRPGCHLCEVARAAIASLGDEFEIRIEEVNIDTDPALYDEYKNEIPVVFINGVKAFKYRVDPAELRRKLKRRRD
jgi:glutaredoxin